MSETIQTIARLTPLAEALALIGARVKPVTPHALDLAIAADRRLAADVTAAARPPSAIALQDGWAVSAGETLGAGGYAPAPLSRVPLRIEAGRPMPEEADSVAPPDAVAMTHGGAEALQTINPGDGVLPAGGDSDPAVALRRAGQVLRLTDCATLAAAGVTQVEVREPRILVVPLRDDPIVGNVAQLLVRDIARHGGAAQCGHCELAAALADESNAVVAIGGTGSGRNDNSVETLRRDGTLIVHGMALTPGETAAFGYAAAMPVLLLPGRLDAALAVWLTVGRRMLARLAGAGDDEDEPAETMRLSRKIASTVGLAEVVPVLRQNGQAEPLATKYLPLSVLARSDGWVLVPAESEGYSVGSSVQVRPWP